MYRFSRAIYRALQEEIGGDAAQGATSAQHEKVLRAAEAAVERLALDRHYFANPTRTLFREIRPYFPVHAQAHVLRVVDHYLTLADQYLSRVSSTGEDVTGQPLSCRATTRRGTPCRREPLPHNGYCPSHQHLAETEERPAAIAA